jgi:hypothetical protein
MYYSKMKGKHFKACQKLSELVQLSTDMTTTQTPNKISSSDFLSVNAKKYYLPLREDAFDLLPSLHILLGICRK